MAHVIPGKAGHANAISGVIVLSSLTIGFRGNRDGSGVMNDLAKMECVPCRGGVPPLKGPDLQKIHDRLGSTWTVVEEHHLEKEYMFDDFRQALTFTNKVGGLAERQGHHPDIYLAWGKVKITIWTHKINGLTESDFILAAKIDALV